MLDMGMVLLLRPVSGRLVAGRRLVGVSVEPRLARPRADGWVGEPVGVLV